LFGFGRDDSIALEGLEYFGSVDNHYILMRVSKGFVGAGLFIMLTICVLGYLGREALARGRPYSDLATALFGAILSVALVLNTVFLDPQLGAAFFFAAGLAGNLRTLTAAQKDTLGTTTTIESQESSAHPDPGIP
jgi:O-antigen ligase